MGGSSGIKRGELRSNYPLAQRPYETH